MTPAAVLPPVRPPSRLPARPIVQQLGFQIAFLLAVVLLPLTLISMMNSFRASTEMRARFEAALTGETLEAAGNVLSQIQEARGSAATLASMIGPLIGDAAACSAALHQMAALLPQYSLIAFIPTDGLMRCSSTDKIHDFSQNPKFQEVLKSARPGFAVNRYGPISGTSVLGVSNPVFDKNGVYLGFVSLSLPHDKFNLSFGLANPVGPREFMTFDRTGTVLVATGGLDTVGQNLPSDRSLTALATDRPVAFTARSVAGDSKVFSVVPAVPGELYVLGTWPANPATSFDDTVITVPFLASALICITSLIVAWLSVEHLVNRHIRKLNTSIKSFAKGDRSLVKINVTGAPLEIREIAAAYEQMTFAVMRDEAELEDAVHQKEVLLREVHHRVKNNLQMIASIMNMHLRKARTPETQEIIKGMQGRVMNLATIYRELYQTSGVTELNVAELLGAIARQAVNLAAGPNRRFDLRISVDNIRMTPDQAIPLALLVGEALMNLVQHTDTTHDGVPVLELSLSQDEPEAAKLEITATIVSGIDLQTESSDGGVALTAQLIHAFAMQLGAQLVDTINDGTYKLQAGFQLRPLAEAEERHAANANQPV